MLEVAGPPLARLRRRQPPPWTPVRVGLRAPLAVLDRLLAERAHRQLERGLVSETQAALSSGVPPDAPALTGIGYAEAVAHLQGRVSLEDLPEVMAQANRRFARRQLRWLRRDPRIEWFDAESDPVPGILAYLEEKLHDSPAGIPPHEIRTPPPRFRGDPGLAGEGAPKGRERGD
jgi:tRNA dimethylallyltransferase